MFEMNVWSLFRAGSGSSKRVFEDTNPCDSRGFDRSRGRFSLEPPSPCRGLPEKPSGLLLLRRRMAKRNDASIGGHRAPCRLLMKMFSNPHGGGL